MIDSIADRTPLTTPVGSPPARVLLIDDDPDTLHLRAERAGDIARPRLVRFLPTLRILTAAFGVGEFVLAALVGEPALAWSAALTIGFAGVVTFSGGLSDAGRPGLATATIGVPLAVMALAGTILVPGVQSAMALLPVLSLVLFLPYARGRQLSAAIAFSLATSTLVLFLSNIISPAPMREPIQDIYTNVILLAIVGLLLAALVDLSTSAVSSLDSLREALAVQHSMRADRVAVSQLLARLERMRPGASVEQTATTIAKALVTLPGIQVGGVLERVGTGLHVLGLVAPTGYPLKPGVLIPEAHAATLIAKSQAGPWAISTAGVPDGDRENIDSIDLRATAWAPLWSGDEMVGLIGIGTSDEAMTAHLVTDLPAIGEVAATVSALLGPELSARRSTSASKHEIRQLIADRAFWPVFQPIVSTPDRQVVGYEALTRFRDLAPPDQRFREAARLGLDVELELATLEAALRAAQRLVPSDAWLSLNVSPALVAQRTRLGRVLRRSTHPLVLELTEHTPIADYGRLRSHLAALDVPFRIAVDDAGAGYASMQHIVELRPSLIKLDISLVRGVHADPVRQALVAGMRYFADRVECGLLAEGVETEAELATLSTLGVPLAQGYLFGRPVPVEEITAPLFGAGLGQPRTPPTLKAPTDRRAAFSAVARVTPE